MLIAHKEIGDVTHRLIYHSPEYLESDAISMFSSEYPDEYYYMGMTPQAWEYFSKKGDLAWGHKEHLRWDIEPADPNNPNQIHFSDFKDPLTDAETRKKAFAVTELKGGDLL